VKKLRVLLLCLASLTISVVLAGPAHAVEPCWSGQVCFYVDKNFEGFRTNSWDDANPKNQKLRFSSHPESRTVSSIRNLTPYYFNIWNAKGQRRCIPPGYKLGSLGSWDNNVHYIGLYTTLC